MHERPHAYSFDELLAGLPEATPVARERGRERAAALAHPAAATTPVEKRLRSALDAIPTDPQALDDTLGNPPGSHVVWVNTGRAIERLGWGERGFEIWHDWCARSPEYNLAGLLTNWRSFERTRRDEEPVTIDTIFYYARQFGWKDEAPETVEPTYPAVNSMPVEEARLALDQHIDAFIRQADTADLNWAERAALEGLPPPAWAIRASTGIGKTQRFAAMLARRRPALPCVYLVPTHRLGEDIAKYFEEHGLSARVYRGRDAADPTIPGNLERPKPEQVRMCLEPEKVALARACGQQIETTCCWRRKRGVRPCASYEVCGYQRQLRTDAPDVWLAAHNMLFHPLRAFKEASGVVVDETFYPTGIVGMTAHGDEGDHVFTVNDLAEPMPYGRLSDDFIQMLREHPLGGIERDRVIGMMTPDGCTGMIKEEWRIINSVELRPQMTAEEVAEVKEQVPTIRKAKFRISMWRALRDLLEAPEGTVSGRLLVRENKKGKRVLRSRGVREIVEAREVPTLILDATLPDVEVLRTWYPQVEVAADIEVKMPAAVHVRQVLKAPVSQGKLWGSKRRPAKEHNLRSIRRYVLQRWLEADRQATLVICQKDVERWLKEAGLPEGISVEHFNAISGLDQYKHVRSLILVGRTVPSPTAVEDVAGALTGVQPVKVAATGNWYDRVTRGIRLADGTGVAVEADQHPDPMAEAVRYQICEAELMQALGRARGINRGTETPLQIDILADVVLPITVDEVLTWEEPSAAVEMAVEGITLNNPADMAKAWTGVWATAAAAKETLRDAREKCLSSIYNISIEKRHFSPLLYRIAITKFSRAFFDSVALPNPRAWLEARLGALANLLHLFREGDVPSLQGQGGLIVNDSKVVVIPAKLPWHMPQLEEIDYATFARMHPAALEVSRNRPEVGGWRLVAGGERRAGPSYGC
jgi:putative DNA primase/helicase